MPESQGPSNWVLCLAASMMIHLVAWAVLGHLVIKYASH